MSGLIKYAKTYGGITFDQMPFNDADNFVFCRIFYAPYEHVVGDDYPDEPMTLAEAGENYFAYCGNKYKTVGLILPNDISRLALNMRYYPRYSDTKIVRVHSVFDKATDLQFAACTFVMPDGKLFICFRGTDDTFTGWKEDFNILTNGGIPSFKISCEYIEDVAAHYDGDIYLGGHSKGGILALYAALSCSSAVRKRIKGIYNNEGPGFADYSYFETPEYREILPVYHHIVPNNSMIGMLLAHDDDLSVIKSSFHIGPAQHEIKSWQIDGNTPVYLPDLTKLGKIHKLGFERLHAVLTEKQAEAMCEMIFSCANATEYPGLLEFALHIARSNHRINKQLRQTEPELKNEVLDTMGLILKTMAKTTDDVLRRRTPVIRRVYA